MDEAEARAAVDVPRETMERLDAFIDYLRAENLRQNLVSAGSLAHIWSRHILDSAQLVRFAPQQASPWLDLGSGAGFPGLIVPMLHRSNIVLIEARKLRAEFLRRAAVLLGVDDRVEIVCARVQTVPARRFGVISARAFAPLGQLLAAAERFSTGETRWILPKGRNATSDLDAVRSSWQGDVRLEPSLTDPDARIIVASEVRRRKRDKSAR